MNFVAGFAAGFITKIEASELSRSISNLVKNSVEAIQDAGTVLIKIKAFERDAQIIIRDDGRGIPPELIARLGERGLSSGKENTDSGTGLGLFHARNTIEGAGGTISVNSRVGEGTEVILTLPRANAPKWFIPAIALQDGCDLISVDDDQTIHQIWS